MKRASLVHRCVQGLGLALVVWLLGGFNGLLPDVGHFARPAQGCQLPSPIDPGGRDYHFTAIIMYLGAISVGIAYYTRLLFLRLTDE